MQASTPESPRYPVGRFQFKDLNSPAERAQQIELLRSLPSRVEALVSTLADAELEIPYRPEGWTIRQVVHHIPDSHMNAYLRCKLAITQDEPRVFGYPQEKWALLADSRGPIEPSLQMLKGIHARWVLFLESLKESDWKRVVHHDEWDRPLTVDLLLNLYAWHGQHHLAHIQQALKKEM